MSVKERLWGLRREPLVHFLLGGLAIFLFFAWRGTEPDPASRTIIIEQAQVECLAAQFSQTFRRPPNPREIDGLIRDHIKEEVYYREARRLGLDEGDEVIRQRLRQKMEYFARSTAESEQPSDAQLQEVLDADPAKYASGARISFDQVYLGENAPAADTVLHRLRQGADWQGLGEPLSVPRSMEQATASEIAREFGEDFASELSALAGKSANMWQGPAPSGYGMHLVRLRAVDAPSAPRLAQVRQQVENDWRAATVDAREKAAYQALLDAYSIRIEQP